MKIHWFENKQLDRVTNYSTEIEIIKNISFMGTDFFYYCFFSKRKVYFDLGSQIMYLGNCKNRYIKYLEFRILVVFKALQIILTSNNNIIMVNHDLIKHMLPALYLNKLTRKNNKFIADIRTTPVCPETFYSDMKDFHLNFKYAVSHYDGLSFITPFMGEYLLDHYNLKNYKSVIWSSGVDTELFNPVAYSRRKVNEGFNLFYHGGISVSRGNLDLIKACELVKNEGYDIKLVQIGILVDKSISQYIENQKINEWCKLLPPVDLHEIPQMIANCDLPVLPFPDFMAWRVSSPIKLMEYLAMGKKVLAPNLECFTDVFSENSDLVFYYQSDPDDNILNLSKEIKYIIDNSALENGNFYPEARNFVCDRYTWEKQASNLFEFCSQLLKN